MKTNNKQYKIKNKDLEIKLLENITRYLNWKGSFMIFNFVDIYDNGKKRVYGHARVDLKIRYYKK